MRNIYSISLAAVLILNTIAGISILCFHHYRIDFMIESIIRSENYSDNLHQLAFNNREADDLIWLKDGREFIHRGHMYDVVRTEVINDGRIIYHCIKDEKEKEIYNSMAHDLGSSSSGPSHDRQLLLQFFRLVSLPVILPSTLTINDQHVNPKSNFSYTESLHTVCLAVASEPPDSL